VVFLPEVGNQNCILDINEFKKGLEAYPKRKSQQEEEDQSRAARIEDALGQA